MKLKKLTVCLLAAVLSFSAFAPAAQAVETTTPITTDSTQGIVPGEAASFTPEASSFTSYTVTLPAGAESVIQEINMEHAGYIYIPMSIAGTEKGITAQLYSDASCTEKTGYSKYLSSGTLEATLSAPITKAGTYYLQFTYKGTSSDVAVTISPYCYNSETRKINVKEDVYSFSGNNELLYHEISIPKTGYIKVAADSDNYVGSTYVTLYNSKKEACSNSVYLSNTSKGGVTYFAVKKGTYYIALKGTSSAVSHLNYSFTAVSEKSGTSKKKAVTISQGKTVKGLVQSEDSMEKYDYYKIKLTKKQALSLTITSKSCDQLKFKVIPASSKLTIFGDTVRIYDSDKVSFKSKDKFPAGTYYIQVEKGSKTTSGYYTIKFN
ncbi:MAG: hypothetical protein ACOCM4_07290 [Acetivibrio ethanolgignens]